MTLIPPTGYDYFTLTPSWDSGKAVSFWDRFGDGGILNPVLRSYGFGNENAFGNHPRSRAFAGYLWNATVRANPYQYQAIAEIVEEQASRASANQEAYFVLSDRYNWYPKIAHTRYSRSVISGTLNTTRTPNIARLAFPVIVTSFSAEPSKNLANATNEPDHAIQIDLVEIP